MHIKARCHDHLQFHGALQELLEDSVYRVMATCGCEFTGLSLWDGEIALCPNHEQEQQ